MGPCQTSTAGESQARHDIIGVDIRDGNVSEGNMSDRRTFLIQGVLVLSGISAGTFTPLEAAMNVRGRREFLTAVSPTVAATGATLPQDPVVGFGWEIVNINNNGADVFFEVRDTMILNTINIDVSFMITSAPAQAGFAEILCDGGVSRGAKPTFNTSPAAYLNLPPSANFGELTPHNPNKLNIGLGGVVQDLFFNVILKTWVPADGTGGYTSRQVYAQPSLALNKGDYLMFHMDHAGVGGDVEMQAVLQYTVV
jgi:hypothetical protein